MRKALVLVNAKRAGVLIEHKANADYEFIYDDVYSGPPVSLTLPLKTKRFTFSKFPSFFDGLLPEGPQLEGLLRDRKIDRNDLLSQLIAVGLDLVGAVTVIGDDEE